jgi:hypothetical protein
MLDPLVPPDAEDRCDLAGAQVEAVVVVPAPARPIVAKY